MLVEISFQSEVFTIQETKYQTKNDKGKKDQEYDICALDCILGPNLVRSWYSRWCEQLL